MFLACASQSFEEVVLHGIEPSSAHRGVATGVTIRGRGFRPGVKISYVDPANSVVDTTFTVTLGELELAEVTYIDARSLTAVVPGELATGTYELQLFSPDGQRASLPAAFTVLPEVVDPDSGPVGTDAALDGGQRDTLVVDAAATDHASNDAESPEAGALDSGLTDLESPDATLPDVTLPDTTLPDTTLPDTALPDLGCTQPTGWWDDTWAYRRQLLIDSSAQTEALLDFPVLVVLGAPGFDPARAAGDGSDLRFVDDDGVTALDHQIERWDPAGLSYIWVKVPRVEAAVATDHIWIYYGKPGVADIQDPSATFSNGYFGVWHLNETSGAHSSSAATATDCTWAVQGAGSQDAPGQIAGADRLDGEAEYLACGNNLVPSFTHHTITAWVRLDFTGAADNYQILSAENTNRAPFNGLSLYVDRASHGVGRWYGADYIYSTVHLVTEGAWAFIAVRGHRDASGYVDVSLDGAPWERIISGNTEANLTVSANHTPFVIGTWPASSEFCYSKGSIDEVRFSSVARSDDWIHAQYLSMSGGLLTVGAEEAGCP